MRDFDRTAGSSDEGVKISISRVRSLDERRDLDAVDLRLWSGLNVWRAHLQIHLGETRGTGSRGTAFTAETDEYGLRAGGGDARRNGVSEAGDAADGHSRAGCQNRIEKIHALCAEVSHDELRTVGCQSQAAQSRVWRRTARGLERGEENILLEVENIDVIDVRQVDVLPLLVVEQEFEESGFRMRLDALKILE